MNPFELDKLLQNQELRRYIETDAVFKPYYQQGLTTDELIYMITIDPNFYYIFEQQMPLQ